MHGIVVQPFASHLRTCLGSIATGLHYALTILELPRQSPRRTNNAHLWPRWSPTPRVRRYNCTAQTSRVEASCFRSLRRERTRSRVVCRRNRGRRSMTRLGVPSRTRIGARSNVHARRYRSSRTRRHVSLLGAFGSVAILKLTLT